MNRIYLEITRKNNEIDLYRFESDNEFVTPWDYDQAIAFLTDQLRYGNIKVWVMKSIPTLVIDKYDLIED